MTPALRTLNFTAHVTSSAGWLGATASFLVLSIAGVASRDAETVRSAYLAMNLIGPYVVVPLSLAALLTGLVQSLGTPWGLVRHYWVLVKLTLSVGATLLLVLHQLTAVAGAANRVSASAAGSFPQVGPVGPQLVRDSGVAVLALLVIAILGVYKPWGRTRYGLRKLQELHSASGKSPAPTPAGVGVPLSLKVFIALTGAIVVLLGALQHLGGHVH